MKFDDDGDITELNTEELCVAVEQLTTMVAAQKKLEDRVRVLERERSELQRTELMQKRELKSMRDRMDKQASLIRAALPEGVDTGDTLEGAVVAMVAYLLRSELQT
jgi:hypothetical protein